MLSEPVVSVTLTVRTWVLRRAPAPLPLGPRLSSPQPQGGRAAHSRAAPSSFPTGRGQPTSREGPMRGHQGLPSCPQFEASLHGPPQVPPGGPRPLSQWHCCLSSPVPSPGSLTHLEYGGCVMYLYLPTHTHADVYLCLYLSTYYAPSIWIPSQQYIQGGLYTSNSHI